MRYFFMTLCSLLTVTMVSCRENDQQETVEFTSGEFCQEVYVWQRVWTEEVIEAVKNRAIDFDRSIILAAEINFQNEEWVYQSFAAPLRWADKHPGEYGLAFRINAAAASTRWTEVDCSKVIEFIRPHVKSAQVIQIDYDCPSKKLSDYTKILEQLRKEFPESSLEITCLPDWLNFDEFGELVQKVDRYVMQVHGVSGHGKGVALCNVDYAHRVAIDCAEFNVPYLIALPTYRHAVSFSKEGKIIQVASEGSYQNSKYELASADPVELSALIERWKSKRPELMKGVIWYRLPVVTDRMNWTWHTLKKVKQGMFKRLAEPEIKVELDNKGIYRLILTNNSKQHIDWPKEISMSWAGEGFCIAHELKRYTTKNIDRSKGLALHWSGFTPYPLASGESLSCGWFRFSERINPEKIIITTP